MEFRNKCTDKHTPQQFGNNHCWGEMNDSIINEIDNTDVFKGKNTEVISKLMRGNEQGKYENLEEMSSVGDVSLANEKNWAMIKNNDKPQNLWNQVSGGTTPLQNSFEDRILSNQYNRTNENETTMKRCLQFFEKSYSKLLDTEEKKRKALKKKRIYESSNLGQTEQESITKLIFNAKNGVQIKLNHFSSNQKNKLKRKRATNETYRKLWQYSASKELNKDFFQISKEGMHSKEKDWAVIRKGDHNKSLNLEVAQQLQNIPNRQARSLFPDPNSLSQNQKIRIEEPEVLVTSTLKQKYMDDNSPVQRHTPKRNLFERKIITFDSTAPDIKGHTDRKQFCGPITPEQCFYNQINTFEAINNFQTPEVQNQNHLGKRTHSGLKTLGKVKDPWNLSESFSKQFND